MLKDLHFGIVKSGLAEKRRFRRPHWDAGTFIFLVPSSVFKVNREPLVSILGADTEISYEQHVDMYLGEGRVSVWDATRSDYMAEDWEQI